MTNADVTRTRRDDFKSGSNNVVHALPVCHLGADEGAHAVYRAGDSEAETEGTIIRLDFAPERRPGRRIRRRVA